MSKIRKEHLHYLKILLADGSVFQPEIRKALAYAIKKLTAKPKPKKGGENPCIKITRKGHRSHPGFNQ